MKIFLTNLTLFDDLIIEFKTKIVAPILVLSLIVLVISSAFYFINNRNDIDLFFIKLSGLIILSFALTVILGVLYMYY